MRRHDFCILENKGTDQLSGYRAADQRLCLHYVDSTCLLLLYSHVCVGNQEDRFSHEAAQL